jgi:hypothetical protein
MTDRPNEVHYPVSKGIKFIRKANIWCKYENFNKPTVPDKIKYAPNKEEL